MRKSLETGTRLSIKLSTKPAICCYVYEMDLGKVNLDVVWVENDNGNGYLAQITYVISLVNYRV